MEEHLRPKELVGSSSLSRGTRESGHTALEIERKYDVALDAVRPDCVGIAGITSQSIPVEHALDATYFDTESGALAQQHTALRHRRGGHDAGWHAKTHTADGVMETHWRTEHDMRVSLGLEEPVIPIARIQTVRTAVTLFGERQDAPLAEFADDEVIATNLIDHTERRWREWEIELSGEWTRVDADRFFETLEPRLVAAGAVPSPIAAKLQRALGLAEEPHFGG